MYARPSRPQAESHCDRTRFATPSWYLEGSLREPSRTYGSHPVGLWEWVAAHPRTAWSSVRLGPMALPLLCCPARSMKPTLVVGRGRWGSLLRSWAIRQALSCGENESVCVVTSIRAGLRSGSGRVVPSITDRVRPSKVDTSYYRGLRALTRSPSTWSRSRVSQYRLAASRARAPTRVPWNLEHRSRGCLLRHRVEPRRYPGRERRPPSENYTLARR